jgi:hypothetical protein
MDALGSISGKPLMGLSLCLIIACLVQASPISHIVRDPEDWLLGVTEWFSVFLVLPILGLSYVCLLVSHFAISAVVKTFRFSMARARLLKFFQYATSVCFRASLAAHSAISALPTGYSSSSRDT